MRKIQKKIIPPKPGVAKKAVNATSDDMLRHLAFDNSLQANIISTVSNGKIIMANHAACKLLGYSKKEILTKDRVTIFNMNERGFKKLRSKEQLKGNQQLW